MSIIKFLFIFVLIHLTRTTQAEVLLMPNEKLINSSGAWHRKQAKHIDFKEACGYLFASNLDYSNINSNILGHLHRGCHVSVASNMEYRGDFQRVFEIEALKDLYQFTNGDHWKVSDNWFTGDPCWNSWYGLECNEYGFIRSINLADNRLVGSLPPSINNLIYLEELYLCNTAVGLSIRSYENANQIFGVIPSLRKLGSLQVLDISGNFITSLSHDLLSNAKLEVLSASRNLLTVFPAYIHKLSKLRILELQSNRISGILNFKEICSLMRIKIFDVGNNSLKGSFDSCLTNLNPLIFDVSGAYDDTGEGFNGEFPTSVIPFWTEIMSGYLSLYHQFGLTGHMATVCSDVRFCYRYMFDSHGDLTWADKNQIPDTVPKTISMARAA